MAFIYPSYFTFCIATGISPMVSNDRESVSDSDDNPVQNRNAWSSSSQLEERSSSFDEFVNSEVAVARAMVDERYMDNLNDAQKKRVERLKAYRKISGDQIAASENESSNVSIGASLPSNSSNITKVIDEEVPGHKPIDVSEKEIQSVGKTKSLIPIKTTKKPLPNLRKRGIKPGMVKKVDTQNKPQVTTKVEPIMQDVFAQVPNKRSKQKLSKPTSSQKKQWTMKEQHVVQKQQQTKEHRQMEQSDQAAKDAEPVKGIKDLVKIGGKGEVVCVNDTNMQTEEGDIINERIHVTSSSSSKRGAQASKGTQTGAHIQEEHTIKLRPKGQQTGQKVLKFAANVMWQNSNSIVHDPSTEDSDTKLRGIVKQPPNLITTEMDRSEQKEFEELPLLKKSSAVTRLTLECETEDEIQSDSAPVLKQRHKNTDESCSDSDLLLNLGRLRSSHRSLNKRSTNARRRRIINADDSNSDDSSPEHSAYAGSGQPRATRVSHGGTKFASQGGGYGAAYAKKRETNRKRIIRVSNLEYRSIPLQHEGARTHCLNCTMIKFNHYKLQSLRTPQCKPKEKKESPGYLKKFLHSSTAQNYLEALMTSSAAPSKSQHTNNAAIFVHCTVIGNNE
jgi:hypothetical protein